MIFGAPMTPQDRIPFQRPPEASFYTPRIPESAFYSHLHPFMNVMGPMAAMQTRIPGMAARANMAPGVRRLENAQPPVPAGPLKQVPAAVVAPPPATPMDQVGPGPTPGGPGAPDAPVHGFGYAGFGSTGGVGGSNALTSAGGSPYRVMRSGMYPGVMANVSNVRHGVYGASTQIRAQTPAPYPGANVSAGNYAGGHGRAW